MGRDEEEWDRARGERYSSRGQCKNGMGRENMRVICGWLWSKQMCNDAKLKGKSAPRYDERSERRQEWMGVAGRRDGG